MAYTLHSIPTQLTRVDTRFYDLTTGQPYNPASPFFEGSDYKLVGPDGTQYLIESDRGIVEEIRANGAQLFYGENGITTPIGDTLEFLYDAGGRLICVETPDGTSVHYEYDEAGNPVGVRNSKTGESKRYGYDQQDAHLLMLALRSHGANEIIRYAGAPEILRIQADLAGPAQFSGKAQTYDLQAGDTDRFAFHLSDSELASTATGNVLVQVTTRSPDASFVPAPPKIAELDRLSVQNRDSQAVALFRIDRAGLDVLQLAAEDATASGEYQFEIRIAGDINGDGRVDGTDSALMAEALGNVAGDAE